MHSVRNRVAGEYCMLAQARMSRSGLMRMLSNCRAVEMYEVCFNFPLDSDQTAPYRKLKKRIKYLKFGLKNLGIDWWESHGNVSSWMRISSSSHINGPTPMKLSLYKNTYRNQWAKFCCSANNTVIDVILRPYILKSREWQMTLMSGYTVGSVLGMYISAGWESSNRVIMLAILKLGANVDALYTPDGILPTMHCRGRLSFLWVHDLMRLLSRAHH